MDLCSDYFWPLSPLIPIQGDYATASEVRLAFDKGADFVTPAGLVANKFDLADLGLDHVAVRYSDHGRVTVLNVNAWNTSNRPWT